MKNHRFKELLPTLMLSLTLLAAGGVAGFLLRPVILPVAAHAEDDHDTLLADDAHDHGANVVELMESTLENMNLLTGKFEVRDYFETIRIPAKVVERIPQSRRQITAPIAGRVRKVFIASGQALRPGEPMFELQITDESIADAQADWLVVNSEVEMTGQQLARLRPMVERGIVAGKRVIDLELELEKLRQRKSAILQELKIRGMTGQQINDFVDSGQLAQSLTIHAPPLESNPTVGQASPPALQPVSFAVSTPAPRIDEHVIGLNKWQHASKIESLSQLEESARLPHVANDDHESYFTVETINAVEGTSLKLGDSLCELTYHLNLLIKGMAFESDVRRIAQADERGWSFVAHFGEHEDAVIREGLKMYQIENHVDNESQTYPVFVELHNEIVSRTTDESDRRYVNWLFKPGQRAHLEVPIRKWEKSVVVPLAALVREGPEAFVFQKISHTHETPEGTVFEFMKVPVKVLHTDKRHAVLAKTLKLDIYEQFALDQAYQLNLALKQAAGGGADAHAGHSH